jgi:hypothetical protein
MEGRASPTLMSAKFGMTLVSFFGAVVAGRGRE